MSSGLHRTHRLAGTRTGMALTARACAGNGSTISARRHRRTRWSCGSRASRRCGCGTCGCGRTLAWLCCRSGRCRALQRGSSCGTRGWRGSTNLSRWSRGRDWRCGRGFRCRSGGLRRWRNTGWRWRDSRSCTCRRGGCCIGRGRRCRLSCGSGSRCYRCCRGSGSRGFGQHGCGCSRWPHSCRFRCRILGVFFRFSMGFRLRLGVGYALQVLANFLRDIYGNGAGVRLLFGDAVPGEQVDDRFGLDLQLARQFIDSNLICVSHAY